MLSKYPILGRDSELAVFNNLLQNIIKTRSERINDKNVRPKESALIIRQEILCRYKKWKKNYLVSGTTNIFGN